MQQSIRSRDGGIIVEDQPDRRSPTRDSDTIQITRLVIDQDTGVVHKKDIKSKTKKTPIRALNVQLSAYESKLSSTTSGNYHERKVEGYNEENPSYQMGEKEAIDGTWNEKYVERTRSDRGSQGQSSGRNYRLGQLWNSTWEDVMDRSTGEVQYREIISRISSYPRQPFPGDPREFISIDDISRERALEIGHHVLFNEEPEESWEQIHRVYPEGIVVKFGRGMKDDGNIEWREKEEVVVDSNNNETLITRYIEEHHSNGEVKRYNVKRMPTKDAKFKITDGKQSKQAKSISISISDEEVNLVEVSVVLPDERQVLDRYITKIGESQGVTGFKEVINNDGSYENETWRKTNDVECKTSYIDDGRKIIRTCTRSHIVNNTSDTEQVTTFRSPIRMPVNEYNTIRGFLNDENLETNTQFSRILKENWSSTDTDGVVFRKRNDNRITYGGNNEYNISLDEEEWVLHPHNCKKISHQITMKGGEVEKIVIRGETEIEDINGIRNGTRIESNVDRVEDYDVSKIISDSPEDHTVYYREDWHRESDGNTWGYKEWTQNEGETTREEWYNNQNNERLSDLWTTHADGRRTGNKLGSKPENGKITVWRENWEEVVNNSKTLYDKSWEIYEPGSNDPIKKWGEKKAIDSNREIEENWGLENFEDKRLHWIVRDIRDDDGNYAHETSGRTETVDGSTLSWYDNRSGFYRNEHEEWTYERGGDAEGEWMSKWNNKESYKTAEKTGKNAQGSWKEYWSENDNEDGTRSTKAYKKGSNKDSGNVWEERWEEYYHPDGSFKKETHKSGRNLEEAWEEAWGDDISKKVDNHREGTKWMYRKVTCEDGEREVMWNDTWNADGKRDHHYLRKDDGVIVEDRHGSWQDRETLTKEEN